MKGPTLCWRRNFLPPTWDLCRFFHSDASAGVKEFLSSLRRVFSADRLWICGMGFLVVTTPVSPPHRRRGALESATPVKTPLLIQEGCPALAGRGGRGLVFILQFSTKRPVQQRPLQFLQRGQLLPVDGFQALGHYLHRFILLTTTPALGAPPLLIGGGELLNQLPR